MFSLVSRKFLSMRNIKLYSVYNCWSQLSQELHSQICPRNLIHSVHSSRILVKNSAYILVKFCGHLPWPQYKQNLKKKNWAVICFFLLKTEDYYFVQECEQENSDRQSSWLELISTSSLMSCYFVKRKYVHTLID